MNPFFGVLIAVAAVAVPQSRVTYVKKELAFAKIPATYVNSLFSDKRLKVYAPAPVKKIRKRLKALRKSTAFPKKTLRRLSAWRATSESSLGVPRYSTCFTQGLR